MQVLSWALQAAGSPLDCHSLVSNQLVGLLIYVKVNQKEQVWEDAWKDRAISCFVTYLTSVSGPDIWKYDDDDWKMMYVCMYVQGWVKDWP
jgi:hypothetical protein